MHPKAGGAERTIYEISKRLVALGNEVTIYSPKWIGSKEKDVLDGVKIIRKGNNLSTHVILPFFLLKNKFDVVINDLAHGIPWISSVFLEKKNVVFFRHLHARSLPGQVNIILAKIITALEKMYPFIYRNSTIVTESSTSETDLIYLGFKIENIQRIPPGIDLDLFHPGEKTKNVQLLYFGGLRKYKRPEYVIKVYEELCDEIKELKVIVIGDGPLLTKMKEYVKNRKYNIDFLGKIEYNELSKRIRESWINLHFSVTEGWGLSIMESSASGTPSVSFEVPGVVDIIKNDYNGFLVNDISEFKEKILYIIDKEDFFINNSRKFAEGFTWDNTSKMWCQLLNKTKSSQK